MTYERKPISLSGQKKPKPETLRQLKEAALAVSASSKNKRVDDARTAFGFFPMGIEGVVTHWPKL